MTIKEKNLVLHIGGKMNASTLSLSKLLHSQCFLKEFNIWPSTLLFKHHTPSNQMSFHLSFMWDSENSPPEWEPRSQSLVLNSYNFQLHLTSSSKLLSMAVQQKTEGNNKHAYTHIRENSTTREPCWHFHKK